MKDTPEVRVLSEQLYAVKNSQVYSQTQQSKVQSARKENKNRTTKQRTQATMLKSWSIENFKAIVNSGDLKLAPITILAGKNSSGKSSLLQSILMIAQTLSNQNRDLALLTNGDLAELRTFEDILSDYTQSDSMKIKFQLEGIEKANQERFVQAISIKFRSVGGNNNSSSAIEASEVLAEEISAIFLLPDKEPIKGLTLADIANYNDFWEKLEFSIKKASENEINHFVEKSPLKRLRQKTSHLGKIIYKSEFSSYSGAFLSALFHFLPTMILTIPDEDDDQEVDIIETDASLSRNVEIMTEFFTSQIRYLGPLRAKPNITAQGFSTKGNIDDIGTEGEFAASVYHANQNAAIDWYNPVSKQVEQGTLKDALDAWVRYLGVAHQVTTEVAGLAGVMWKVVLIDGQKAHTLPEVGVGLSQILPILVMGLLSPKDSLLIMEQPELHLHPQVQARLGDFFVGISKCHKQCLIETHSENIVSQLRYHIVEAGGQENSDCIIYFVDQDEKGAAKFEPIEISPNGNILNWPDGFFDETMHQENRINAASIRRRARLKKNG